MKDSSLTLAFACFLMLTTCLGITVLIAYENSFTADGQTIGGYMGVLIPILMCIGCFVSGFFTNSVRD